MKVITVNLPQTYIKEIDSMIGENSLYPSRSELIRVAVRDFLISQLELLERITKMSQNTKEALIKEKTPEGEVLTFSEADGRIRTIRVVKKDSK